MAAVTQAAIGFVLVLIVVVGGSYLWANHEYTECYAMYPSKHAAEQSVSAWQEAGFDVSIERRSGWGAIVTDGSTGSGPPERFRRVLAETDGRSGHGSYGCVVRGPIQ